MKRRHSKKDADYCLWYVKKHLFKDCMLIGAFGKGKERSFKNIEIALLIEKLKLTEATKELYAKLLDAKSFEETERGSWLFSSTVFGNVELHFNRD